MHRLRALGTRTVVSTSVALVGATALADWATGPDVQVVFFYLVPVVGAAWYAGIRAGVALAVVATATSFAIASATPDGHSTATATVNALTRLALLLCGLAVIASERRHVDLIEELASRDPLTGALNRRAFDTAVQADLRLTAATPGTMLYLDVDGLKALNDTRGHDAGDEHLVALAAIIRASIRQTDHFARLGGDEFAVFLAGQDSSAARRVADRLVATCAARPDDPIRVSIGVAPASADGDRPSVEHLLRRADDVMYDAKRAGGGTRVADPD